MVSAQSPSPNDDMKDLLPMFAALIFLLIGFFMSFQVVSLIFGFAAKGVKSAVKVAKFTGKTVGEVGKFAGKTAVGAAVGAASGVVGAARGSQGRAGFWRKVGGAIGGATRGVITKTGRKEGEQAMFKGAVGAIEKTPLGGTVWHRRMKEKMRPKIEMKKEEKEKLKNASIEELKGYVSGKAMTFGDRQTQLEAARQLGERGKFDFDSTTEQKIMSQVQSLDFDLSDLAKSRPDLAPDLNVERMKELTDINIAKGLTQDKAKKAAKQEIIKTEIEKMSPGEFREKVSAKSLENEDVFFAMDVQKIREIGVRAGKEKRQAIKNHAKSGSRTRGVLLNMHNEARKNGDKQEIQRLKSFLSAILNNPNFKY